MYDGWNLLAEINMIQNPDGSTYSTCGQRSYAWGYDLSGTEQGAGGVGGLVLVNQPSTTVNNGQPSSTALAPCYDGNGNIHTYLDCATGAITQRMEYDAFGNEMTLDSVLESGGGTIREMPFRFSTKYTDSETSLSYYGYRYYSAEMGRWLNRDPIEERGGVNLYGIVENDMLNKWDVLGLQDGRDGAGGYARKCCQKSGGKWHRYADEFFNGSVRECVKSFLGEPEVIIGGGSIASSGSLVGGNVSGALGASVGFGSVSSFILAGITLQCEAHSCYK